MSPASGCAKLKPKGPASSVILRAAGRCVSTSNKQLARRLGHVESRNVTYRSDDFPVFWESGDGTRVRDIEGRKYLDLTSAFAVSSLGHRAPAVQRAIISQSRKMWHGMG